MAAFDCDGQLTVTVEGRAVSNIVLRTEDGDTKLEEIAPAEDCGPDLATGDIQVTLTWAATPDESVDMDTA